MTGAEKERVGQTEERFHISRDGDGELHLIAPSAVHMCCKCSERERHPLLNGNSCASATAAV